MSAEKIEGTIVLEGLIQGRLPDEDEATESLRQWVRFMAKLGLAFNLETRNAAFSLLPDNRAASAAALDDSPEHTLRQALEQLVASVPEQHRGQMFSTLRATYYRPGEEVQSVFAIVDGKVRVESRAVDAHTTPPPEPLSNRERIKLGAIGALIAVVLLGVAMLFPGVRAMFGQVAEMVRPFNVDEIAVDLGPYKSYFSCQLDAKDSDRNALVLQFKRAANYPQDSQQLDRAMAEESSTVARLALENLARGYVRVEMFDEKEKFVGTTELRIADLRHKEMLDVKIRLPEKTKISKLVFGL
jgi:hypothetical protein